MQSLRRAKRLALKTMRDHEVIADIKAVHPPSVLTSCIPYSVAQRVPRRAAQRCHQGWQFREVTFA